MLLGERAHARDVGPSILGVRPQLEELEARREHLRHLERFGERDSDPRQVAHRGHPAKAARENLQDLIWALINTKEFITKEHLNG